MSAVRGFTARTLSARDHGIRQLSPYDSSEIYFPGAGVICLCSDIFRSIRKKKRQNAKKITLFTRPRSTNHIQYTRVSMCVNRTCEK